MGFATGAGRVTSVVLPLRRRGGAAEAHLAKGGELGGDVEAPRNVLAVVAPALLSLLQRRVTD